MNNDLVWSGRTLTIKYGGVTMPKNGQPLVIVVRISQELFTKVQKHAEPLEDDFDSACRKALQMPPRIKCNTQAHK